MINQKAITNLVYRKLSENPVETLQEAFDISTVNPIEN